MNDQAVSLIDAHPLHKGHMTLSHSRSRYAYQRSPYQSIKHSTYFYIYDELFGPYVGKPITFVEIGVLGGGSLFMWREFFGSQARIIGIDLNPQARRWEDDGFEIFIGSQKDPIFLAKFISEIGAIDVVLDDGGHTYEQQIITAECLLPAVSDGGMLVVEDCHTSYMTKYGLRSVSLINYAKNMVDGINFRFGKFANKRSERSVWNVRFFESIVAFYVHREKCNVASEPTHNGGQAIQVEDFRYADLAWLPLPDRHTGLRKFVAKHSRRLALLGVDLLRSRRLAQLFKY